MWLLLQLPSAVLASRTVIKQFWQTVQVCPYSCKRCWRYSANNIYLFVFHMRGLLGVNPRHWAFSLLILFASCCRSDRPQLQHFMFQYWGMVTTIWNSRSFESSSIISGIFRVLCFWTEHGFKPQPRKCINTELAAPSTTC